MDTFVIPCRVRDNGAARENTYLRIAIRSCIQDTPRLAFEMQKTEIAMLCQRCLLRKNQERRIRSGERNNAIS